MSRPRALRGPWLNVGGSVVLLLAAWWLDGTSSERGNRLHRRGEPAAAIELYRRHAGDGPGRARYNLGTAWLVTGSPAEAEPHLTAARETTDLELRSRSEYNLGSLLLVQALEMEEPVMGAQLAGEAVLAFRSTLRADAGSGDARWNLGIAMRLLDSLSVLAPGTATGIPTRADAAGLDRASDAGSTARSGASDAGGEATAPGSGDALLPEGEQRPSGAQEALAEAGQMGAATPEEVQRVLATAQDEVSGLLRRVLWFLGARDLLGERARRTGEW